VSGQTKQITPIPFAANDEEQRAIRKLALEEICQGQEGHRIDMRTLEHNYAYVFAFCVKCRAQVALDKLNLWPDATPTDVPATPPWSFGGL